MVSGLLSEVWLRAPFLAAAGLALVNLLMILTLVTETRPVTTGPL